MLALEVLLVRYFCTLVYHCVKFSMPCVLGPCRTPSGEVVKWHPVKYNDIVASLCGCLYVRWYAGAGGERACQVCQESHPECRVQYWEGRSHGSTPFLAVWAKIWVVWILLTFVIMFLLWRELVYWKWRTTCYWGISMVLSVWTTCVMGYRPAVKLWQHITHTFSYVINLTQSMLMKLEGYSIVGCEPVHRLVEIRTVRIMSKNALLVCSYCRHSHYFNYL